MTKQLNLQLAELTPSQEMSVRNREQYYDDVDELGEPVRRRSFAGSPFGLKCSRCNRDCQVNGGSMEMDKICPAIGGSEE